MEASGNEETPEEWNGGVRQRRLAILLALGTNNVDEVYPRLVSLSYLVHKQV
jgi:hypothetical protein